MLRRGTPFPFLLSLVMFIPHSLLMYVFVLTSSDSVLGSHNLNPAIGCFDFSGTSSFKLQLPHPRDLSNQLNIRFASEIWSCALRQAYQRFDPPRTIGRTATSSSDREQAGNRVVHLASFSLVAHGVLSIHSSIESRPVYVGHKTT